MYNWNAPATLVYWPGRDGVAEKECATLRDAIREAEGDAEQTPWIVTWNGDLHPREIEALKVEGSPAPVKKSRLGFSRSRRQTGAPITGTTG